MKLVIMFLVGLALIGIPAAYLFYGNAPITQETFYLVFPMAIGGFLMLLSGTKGLKKFDRYLDN